MLELKGIQGNEIYYRNRLMLKANVGESFVWLGQGVAGYTMSHGAFKFKEKSSKTAFLVKSCEQLNHSIVIECISSEDKGIVLTVSEQGGYLKLVFNDGIFNQYNRVYLRFPMDADECVYGGGEQFAKWNLRGEKVRIWVSEHIPVSSIVKKNIKKLFKIKKEKLGKFRNYMTYMVVPTFITSQKRWIHVDSTEYMDFDFTQDNYMEVEVRGIPKAVLLGCADSFDEIMTEMTAVLGRQAKLPEWVFNGMIFGVQDGTTICDQKIDKINKEAGAIAGLWCQDWEGQRITAFGKQLFWDWSYDEKLYVDLPNRIQEWDTKGLAFLGYINPFLALEGTLFKEAQEKGYLVKNAEGKVYEVTITTFPAAMIDLTNPNCFKWMKEVIKTNMIGIGLKGWMADFGEYLPTDAVLYSGVAAEQIHNEWPAIWARLNREVIEETGNLGQVMFFTRAGYTETNKYSTLMWNGDQHVDWSRDYGMASIVNSQLSLSAIGCGASHSDIGGYTGFGLLKREKELIIRWAEMSCFSPVMRSHEGNKPDESWQFDSDKETLQVICRLSRIHKQLKPYLMYLDQEKAELGLPMLRPLFYYYNEFFAYTIEQIYLLGRDLLVAPSVNKGMITREVRLPEDTWIHLWTGKSYEGGTYRIGVPLGKPAVFYRKKSSFISLFQEIATH